MGRLVPDRAAVRARDAHRAALVAADGKIDGAGGDERRAAARRTAGGAGRVPRVTNRAGARRVAAAREAEVLTHCLADDRGPGAEQAGDDGGVTRWDEALEGFRPVHHRHAGDHDVVLDRDRAAGQWAVVGLVDRRRHVPGAERVVGVGRTGPRAVGRRRRRRAVVQLLDGRPRVEQASGERGERGDVGGAQAEPVAFGDGGQVGLVGRTDGHGGPPRNWWRDGSNVRRGVPERQRPPSVSALIAAGMMWPCSIILESNAPTCQ